MENIIDIIQRHVNNSVFKNYKKPDYIMIHPVHKFELENEALKRNASQIQLNINGRITKIIDMIIIWTDDIEESEIIPTYK